MSSSKMPLAKQPSQKIIFVKHIQMIECRGNELIINVAGRHEPEILEHPDPLYVKKLFYDIVKEQRSTVATKVFEF